MSKRRLGVIQYPVVTEDFPRYDPKKHGQHLPTGIRCPRCCQREIVYNGNYFCMGFDSRDCEWALPHDDPDPKFPQYDEPKNYWNLVDALIESATRRTKVARNWGKPSRDHEGLEDG